MFWLSLVSVSKKIPLLKEENLFILITVEEFTGNSNEYLIYVFILIDGFRQGNSL